MKSTALIYANSHHDNFQYIVEAEDSCESFKRYIKGVSSVLYCDVLDYESKNFSDIVFKDFAVPDLLSLRNHKRGQMLIKHQAMIETKTDYNLVLGSDTYALSSKVNSVFELLEKFDIAVAHAPYRIVSMSDTQHIPVPESFPEFNCDVIAFRKSDKVMKFIEKWQSDYRNDRFGHPHDQGTFRYLLYYSDLRIATLPPEFNYRGDDYRHDTVILQNREMLDIYLREQQNPSPKVSLFDKVKSRIKK